MKHTTSIAMLAALAVFIGCQSIGERDTGTRVPVTFATLTLIDEDRETAQRVHDLGHEVLSMLDSTGTTIDRLESEIRNQIRWDSLTLAQRILAEELLTEIRWQLNQHVHGELIHVEDRERIRQVIGYVIRAAELSGAE